MENLKTRRDEVFGAGSTLFYSEPIHIVRDTIAQDRAARSSRRFFGDLAAFSAS